RSSLLYGISLREPQIGSRLDRVPATGDRYRIVHLPDFRSPASDGSGLKAREPVGDAREGVLRHDGGQPECLRHVLAIAGDGEAVGPTVKANPELVNQARTEDVNVGKDNVVITHGVHALPDERVGI